MGLNCSPRQFQQRVKDNQWAGYHSGKHHSNPQLTPLDRNNSALGRQLPQPSRGDQRQESDTGQSGYYSENSNFDSVSMMSIATSEASATRERQTEGTFDRHINGKITLPNLNVTQVLMMNGFGWPMLEDILIQGVPWTSWKVRLTRVSQMAFGGMWFHQSQMLGDTVEEALNKMRQTDQHQHSDGLYKSSTQ